MGSYFHSVTLDEEKCKGCTNCIKNCPTEAIRVRDRKARITKERCIDCGECIRICPYHAKKAITDPFNIIENFEHKIVIPAPTLYSQFKPDIPLRKILGSLFKVGFDDVFEVARAAQYVTEATKIFMKNDRHEKPLISSACPAVVRLIQTRFHNLINNLVPIGQPMEIAARMAKEEAMSRGIPEKAIGVFFITPCAAKMTSVKMSYGQKKSYVDGVISIKDIYILLKSAIDKNKDNFNKELAGFSGVRWANSGGEGLALGTYKFLAVDGINNVITIFEEVEKDKIEDIDFIEALACEGGCIGGPLNVENVYVSKSRLKKLLENAKQMDEKAPVLDDILYNSFLWDAEIEPRNILSLDKDIRVAMQKLERIESIYKSLEGLDCGACGAPSCKALAEDIVQGYAVENDCIFKLKDRIKFITSKVKELE